MVSKSDLLVLKIISPSPSSETKPARMITSYNSKTKQVMHIFKKNWHVLETDSILRSIIPTYPLITFRRCKSINDHLVSSHYCTPTHKRDSIIGFYPCMKCKACKYCQKVTGYSTSKSGPKARRKINRLLNCNSEFTVYCLECPCPKRYVGSTIHPMKKALFRKYAGDLEKRSNIYSGTPF